MKCNNRFLEIITHNVDYTNDKYYPTNINFSEPEFKDGFQISFYLRVSSNFTGSIIILEADDMEISFQYDNYFSFSTKSGDEQITNVFEKTYIKALKWNKIDIKINIFSVEISINCKNTQQYQNNHIISWSKIKMMYFHKKTNEPDIRKVEISNMLILPYLFDQKRCLLDTCIVEERYTLFSPEDAYNSYVNLRYEATTALQVTTKSSVIYIKIPVGSSTSFSMIRSMSHILTTSPPISFLHDTFLPSIDYYISDLQRRYLNIRLYKCDSKHILILSRDPLVILHNSKTFVFQNLKMTSVEGILIEFYLMKSSNIRYYKRSETILTVLSKKTDKFSLKIQVDPESQIQLIFNQLSHVKKYVFNELKLKENRWNKVEIQISITDISLMINCNSKQNIQNDAIHGFQDLSQILLLIEKEDNFFTGELALISIIPLKEDNNIMNRQKCTVDSCLNNINYSYTKPIHIQSGILSNYSLDIHKPYLKSIFLNCNNINILINSVDQGKIFKNFNPIEIDINFKFGIILSMYLRVSKTIDPESYDMPLITLLSEVEKDHIRIELKNQSTISIFLQNSYGVADINFETNFIKIDTWNKIDIIFTINEIGMRINCAGITSNMYNYIKNLKKYNKMLLLINPLNYKISNQLELADIQINAWNNEDYFCSLDECLMDHQFISSNKTTDIWKKKSTTDNLKVFPGTKGEKGLRGKQGVTGPKGDPGDKGLIGMKGDKGDMGFRGFPGEPGVRGISVKGFDGVIGSQGNPGKKGEKGNNGKKGSHGVMGHPGHRGKKGLKGFTGSKGNKGDRGARGYRGLTGEEGMTGSPGKTGIIGIKGKKGLKGPKGNFGIIGHKGLNGISGPSGKKGIKGVKGNVGLMGNASYVVGLVGIPGKIGDPGENGRIGKKGEIGEIGKQGPPGNDGLMGKPGISGPKGNLGSAGTLGIKGIRGIASVRGNKGIKGIQGLKGEKGDKGDIGKPGVRGLPGNKGNKGLQGIIGKVGPIGPEGKKGQRGLSQPGIKGKSGEMGAQGEHGEKGNTRIKGEKGNKGLNGPIGEKGEKGDIVISKKGETGKIGIKGNDGPRGPTGAIGLRGEVGPKGLVGVTGPIGYKGDTGEIGEVGGIGEPGIIGAPGTCFLSQFSKKMLQNISYSLVPFNINDKINFTEIKIDSSNRILKLYEQVFSYRNERGSSKDNPAISCKDLYLQNTDSQRVKIWVDPNEGSPYDAFRADCKKLKPIYNDRMNIYSLFTCINSIYESGDLLTYLRPYDSDVTWQSELRLEGLVLNPPDLRNGYPHISQLHFIQIRSTYAEQEIEFLCEESIIYADLTDQEENFSFATGFLTSDHNNVDLSKGITLGPGYGYMDKKIFHFDNNQTVFNITILYDECKYKAPGTFTKIHLSTNKPEMLPILDFRIKYFKSNGKCTLGANIYPVCFH